MIFSSEFDDLDDDWQIFGQILDLGGVYPARMAKAHRSPQNSCTGEMHLAGFQYDGLIERFVPGSLILPEENTEQCGIVRHLHGHTQFGLPIDPHNARVGDRSGVDWAFGII